MVENEERLKELFSIMEKHRERRNQPLITRENPDSADCVFPPGLELDPEPTYQDILDFQELLGKPYTL